ncbi:c-type cytochrome [methanotrophic endosymbiont of Bathymodiolus puteoserpentis (Logatchev)]|uniref:c-type cytochrome n=1 Tax=methanotrophic endosymbiont of Bathymodiolus puteoserpentis (Logatchev) TaxID=343235 RepID=UPI00157B26D9|nr:cytochrome c [methanotrophic endosymbiont of Bathymodiolus puteoserpentis (Logatchev)]
MLIPNWVGGLGGLSSFQYSIGLPPSVTNDLNNDGFPDDDKNHDGFHDNGLTPTSSTAEGKALYVSLGCAASSCHGATPLSGKNDIDRAINPAVTRNAIVHNKGGMGVLSRAGITDAELQAIADYVKNPQ